MFDGARSLNFYQQRLSAPFKTISLRNLSLLAVPRNDWVRSTKKQTDCCHDTPNDESPSESVALAGAGPSAATFMHVGRSGGIVQPDTIHKQLALQQREPNSPIIFQHYRTQ